MKDSIKGTGVAMVTPFSSGQVDYVAYEKVINHVTNGQVEYLVPLGSTGESATLSSEEQRSILDFVIEKNQGKKAIVAGNFGGKNTQAIVDQIKDYNFDGIDAILSSSPEYSKPSQEGIFHHYMALAEVSPVPIIIYNVPGRTKSNIEYETTLRLAEASEKFLAIKEASGDLVQATKIIQHKPDHFHVVSGDDELALPLVALGGSGVISVIANAYPYEFSEMIRQALNNYIVSARKWNKKTYPVHKWLYIDGNPVGIKAAMEVLGICSREVRLPLYELGADYFSSLKSAMQNLD